MKIHIYEVDRDLIERYCRVIIKTRSCYTAELDEERSKIHNQIFDSIGLSRALTTRDGRIFSIKLNETVLEMTEDHREFRMIESVISPRKSLTGV